MARAGSFLSLILPATAQRDLFERLPFAANRREAASGISDDELFNGGPPTRLQTVVGLMRPGRPNIALRIAIWVGIGWLPLLIMTAVQSAVLHDGSLASFLSDYSVHARSLIAVPLLIVAEALCLPRLSAIARHFPETGLIGAADASSYRDAVSSTLRLRDSMRLEIAVLALALIFIAVAVAAIPSSIFPHWYRVQEGGRVSFSPAGWWHGYVSVWVLLVLVLGWAWRLLLWTRFLFLVSRLKLRLIASHPDRAGGLRFTGISAQAFSIVAFALSTIVAGTIANRVMHDGADILSFKYEVLGFVIVVVALFASPLLVFAATLLKTWRDGVFEYGALARDVGARMERKWLNHPAGDTALDANDFSATTDLYAIAGNVYSMGIVPISLVNLGALAVATVLPFLPVAVMAMSPQVVIEKLTGILL